MQLLTFSRKSLFQRKAVDLNELIAESVSLLRRLIGEDVSLQFVADPRLGKVLADPGQIEQVIMNLVVNARDAMPTGGRLVIQTESLTFNQLDRVHYSDLPPGEYARLRVTDTGIGIAPEVIDKIFEPFFTTKDSTKGTGLGLAVAHGVVSQCGGHIHVESIPGQGTTFSILLPTEPVADRDAEHEPPTPHPDGPETILVVEDEEAVRKIACMGLESHGYNVLTAVDVESALALTDQHTGAIDLLITDIVMPGRGIRELVQKLQQTRPNIKVLFISGYTDDAIVRHGIESGRENFLSKPFTPLTLAKKARAMLDEPLGASGSWQLAVGSWQLAVGSWQLAVGSGQWASWQWQLAVGSGQWAVGSGQWVRESSLVIRITNIAQLAIVWHNLPKELEHGDV